jgi:hypothetical protein
MMQMEIPITYNHLLFQLDFTVCDGLGDTMTQTLVLGSWRNSLHGDREMNVMKSEGLTLPMKIPFFLDFKIPKRGTALSFT